MRQLIGDKKSYATENTRSNLSAGNKVNSLINYVEVGLWELIDRFASRRFLDSLEYVHTYVSLIISVHVDHLDFFLLAE
jgi:hypothetical protein